MSAPLAARRALLESRILAKLRDPVRYSVELKASLRDLIASVKAQGLEGLVAKRRGGVYEPGQRSGSWQKMRVNQGAGIRDRRLYAERPEFRRAHYRILN
jgi:bifunctional non-homologous end joining protein LigD